MEIEFMVLKLLNKVQDGAWEQNDKAEENQVSVLSSLLMCTVHVLWGGR